KVPVARNANGSSVVGPVLGRIVNRGGDAALGTCLGWNITADGARPFHKSQICDYVGGMIPFARTSAERVATGDPRLSLVERYRNHDGYVAAVTAAAANAVKQGFLLPEDADALIAQSQASNVLK
ncbi:MAG: alpha/beta hydrolase domain-containing protein, partial [Betaproteobacteria bacterium]